MQIICIMGGSKSGKSTVEKYLSKLGYTPSVSYTTRKINTGGHKDEVNGKDYNFVTREQFNELVRKDIIIEHEELYGNMYGTPRLIGSTKYVAVVGLNGYKALRNIYKGQVLGVMLTTDLETLKQRFETCTDDFKDSNEAKLRSSVDDKMTIEMAKEADIIIDSTIGVENIATIILKKVKEIKK